MVTKTTNALFTNGSGSTILGPRTVGEGMGRKDESGERYT